MCVFEALIFILISPFVKEEENLIFFMGGGAVDGVCTVFVPSACFFITTVAGLLAVSVDPGADRLITSVVSFFGSTTGLEDSGAEEEVETGREGVEKWNFNFGTEEGPEVSVLFDGEEAFGDINEGFR